MTLSKSTSIKLRVRRVNDIVPYTRIIKHKHFEHGVGKGTVIAEALKTASNEL
jgi:hypothetical protein